MLKKIFHGLTFLVMLGIGIAGAAYLNKNKPTVERDESRLTAKVVDVMPIKMQPFRAHITAYGNVAPALTLEGKAQVSGKVTYVHPELKAGGSIVAGTTVVKIDPEDYQVSLDQTRADLSASEAQREQILQEQRNTQKALGLAQRNLKIGEKELARLTSLLDRGLIAASTVDDEAQRTLQLRQSLTDLEGQLATYRSRLNNADAQINRAKQQVKGQKTTLGRTEVNIPFDARINVANVEKGEFVSVGNTLFEASNIDGVEIQAELPMQHMQRLVSAMHGARLNLAPENSVQLINDMHLNAQVRWVDGGNQATWEARVVRFAESVDPIRRTLAVTVAVDKPYEQVIAGERPPLLKGMYVAVDLYTPEYQALVIPRKALHEGRVYLANQANELEVRALDIHFKQGNLAIIRQGVKEGERIIVNDLTPVIPAMPLDPRPISLMAINSEADQQNEQHNLPTLRSVATHPASASSDKTNDPDPINDGKSNDKSTDKAKAED